MHQFNCVFLKMDKKKSSVPKMLANGTYHDILISEASMPLCALKIKL